MKLCGKCGAYNSDERVMCVDCNEMLGDAISEEREAEIKRKTDAITEKLYNRRNALYVSLFDKIVGYSAILLSAALVVIGIITAFQHKSLASVIVGLAFSVWAVVEALLPNIPWGIERFFLSFKVANAENLHPSSFYTNRRRIGEVLSLIFGIILLVTSIFGLTSAAAEDKDVSDKKFSYVVNDGATSNVDFVEFE